LTSQQLLEARAALWRHNADPILTLEDAAAWVETHGFQLFLPRKQQLPAPAPSFVEACLGKLEHTPSRSAIEDALDLARRLFATGEVIPLNLFGTLSEEPDFLISREELPWLLSLRADRSWKSAPGGRTSPLHIHIWKLLDEQGALSVEELRSGVGREVTDAAVRRALVEMWGTLRVLPRYEGEKTEWTLVKAAYPKESAKGATTAQGTALSLFLAGYLRSVIAANEDEISTFLSPLASRSKVREVLQALLTTRQLGAVTLGPNTLYHVAGELPEFPEVAPVEATDGESPQKPAETPASAGAESAPTGERIRKYTPRDGQTERPAREGAFRPSDRRPREYGDRSGRFSRPDQSSRPERPAREDRPAARGYERPSSPRSDGGAYRRPPQDRSGQSDRPRWNDRPARGERQDQGQRPRFPERREGSSERPARRDGGFSPRGGFKPRSGGGFKPGNRVDRPSDGFRPPFRKQQDEGGAFADNRPRRDGVQSRPDFRQREEGARPSFGKKPFGKGASGTGFEKRKPFGERARQGRGEFRPGSSREDRPARKSFGGPRREFSGRKPFTPREGAGTEGGSERPRKPFDGDAARPPRKSFGKPGGFSKSGGSKPAGKSFGKKPGGFGGAKKSYGKSGSGKPFGKGAGKPGRSFGKGPGKGPAKGFGKPKRRPEE
jgi:23S rRNA pseudouridine2605 synthase